MPRRLVETNTKHFVGFGCSACAWVFKPLGAVVGKSLDEMKEKYKAQLNREFAEHACVNHPKVA
jgi:hypothetical protein